MDLSKGWIQYRRQASRKDQADKKTTCGICQQELPSGVDFDVFRKHVVDNPAAHPGHTDEEAIRDTFHKFMYNRMTDPGAKSPRKRASPSEAHGDEPATHHGSGPPDTDQRGRRKRITPPSSVARPIGSPNSPRAEKRSGRDTISSRNMYHPVPISTSPRSTAKKATHARSLSGVPPPPASTSPLENAADIEMLREPSTRTITQEQLVTEVKGIYAGLVMVEAKCIEVDKSNSDPKRQLSKDQWQALIALHRTLLHEHHDFFLASQHPSANRALKNLANKYAMPARMWRHGIHSFLELLRRKLPESLEHMLTFIYLAYSMMALLFETVPAFGDTWIECLGDLGRYRMAIEDDDVRTREVWTGMSAHWYSMASDRQPFTGRLYHHLAILARPNPLQQLFYYFKALCVPTPFENARDSIMTLFEPLFATDNARIQAVDAAYIRVMGAFFSSNHHEKSDAWQEEFFRLLDPQISRLGVKWREPGYHIGIVLVFLLLGFGSNSNELMRAMKQDHEEPEDDSGDSESAQKTPVHTADADKALGFTVKTYEIVVRRWGDTNTLPFIHTIMVFLYALSRDEGDFAHVKAKFPWKLTALMLNFLLRSGKLERMTQEGFPGPEKDDVPRPLPEDHAMRGLSYVEDIYPANFFDKSNLDQEEKYHEAASMVEERKLRILWYAHKIAETNLSLTWDRDKSGLFGVLPEFDVLLNDNPLAVVPGGSTATETPAQAKDWDASQMTSTWG